MVQPNSAVEAAATTKDHDPFRDAPLSNARQPELTAFTFREEQFPPATAAAPVRRTLFIEPHLTVTNSSHRQISPAKNNNHPSPRYTIRTIARPVVASSTESEVESDDTGPRLREPQEDEVSVDWPATPEWADENRPPEEVEISVDGPPLLPGSRIDHFYGENDRESPLPPPPPELTVFDDEEPIYFDQNSSVITQKGIETSSGSPLARRSRSAGQDGGFVSSTSAETFSTTSSSSLSTNTTESGEYSVAFNPEAISSTLSPVEAEQRRYFRRPVEIVVGSRLPGSVGRSRAPFVGFTEGENGDMESASSLTTKVPILPGKSMADIHLYRSVIARVGR